MSAVKTEVLEIIDAQQVSAYKLRLNFDDGKDQVVDFEPFLTASRNPAIRAYLDTQRFSHFRIEHGDLVWGEYDLCFPIADLYEGQI